MLKAFVYICEAQRQSSMKISYNWIKEFIKINWEPQKVADLLTDLGLEVEGMEQYESVKGGLQGIVVGKVLSCDPHPNADRLKITTVDIGQSEPLKIVCGAPNVSVGQHVPVATIGTQLYDESGKAWKIKKGKIRGEHSHGMICAEDEIGLGSNHDGIMVLPESSEIGMALSTLFNIENDTVFEIGLTPNRADAMSHFGVARDLRAGLEQHGVKLEMITPSVSSFHIDNRSLKIDIDIKEREKAPRYCGISIADVTVKPSPDWLQNRIKAIGLSPINNIVDATNFVLHDLGQPLHAFDADSISGNKIIVQTLKSGTKFTTLDGIERILSEEDLMICDAKKPLCIAGVFGGENSGVTENTKNIFLESAYFDPISIRKTAKRHALNTDASFRFERGIDANMTKYALKRAAILIAEISGGEIASNLNDEYLKKIEDFQVFVNFDNIKKIIGYEIPKETIKSILSSLDIKVNNITESGLGLTIPAFRNDVCREVDVIEEILRVYGYNNIPSSSKLKASVAKSSKFESHRIEKIIGDQLSSLGFYELLSNSLTSEKYNNLIGDLDHNNSIKIINPLSSDLSVLRQTMVFSGLEAVAFNINRKKTDIKFFEFGKTYNYHNESREEHKHLSLFISGDKTEENWHHKQNPTNFFFLKGIVFSILERLGIEHWKSAVITSALISDGLQLSVGKNSIVEFGILDSNLVNNFGIKQTLYFADFNWDKLLDVISKQTIKFKSIPKHPAVRRDFALLINEDVRFESIHKLAFETEKKILQKVNLFDVYKGKNLPEGKKSYAVSFLFQNNEKTLTDKEIDKIMSKLQNRLEKELKAELR